MDIRKFLPMKENTSASSSSPVAGMSGTKQLKRGASSPAGLHNVEEDNANLNEICRGINAINEKLITMQNSIDGSEAMLQKIVPLVNKHDSQISSVHSQINYLHQKNICDRIEIIGKWYEIIERKKTSMKAEVMELFAKLEIKIESCEIANAFIKQIRDDKIVKKEILIVIFMHEEIKKRVMAEKFKSQNELAKGIFFNETLTSENRHILYSARQYKRAGKIYSAGSINGRIFIKKIEKTPNIFVNSLMELEELAKLSEKGFREKVNEKTPK